MAELKRKISFWSAIALVIGGVIGSGIFMKPAFIAATLGDPWICLSVWVLAGLITLCGSLSNAEVASMFPETGGQYVFFQKMYGNKFAFLYGWASFSVFNTAGNASIAFVFSQYIGYFMDLPVLDQALVDTYYLQLPFVGSFYLLKDFGIKILSIVVLGILTWINIRSVDFGAGLQRLLTLLKSIAISLLIVGFLLNDKGNIRNFVSHTSPSLFTWEFITAYAACLSAVFWAYDGWNNITFIAGEITEPQKNIPRSLALGLSLCMVIYIAFNFALFYHAPATAIAESKSVAADISSIVWGPIGGTIIGIMVILSVFGTINANVLSTARVTFAMGEGNVFFKKASIVDPYFQTPKNALLWNFIWSALLIFSGSFDMLTDMLIFVSWFFYGASALGLFVLRFKYPGFVRQYKVPFYPYIPAIFVLFTSAFLVITLIADITDFHKGETKVINSLLGLLITSIGILFSFGRKVQ